MLVKCSTFSSVPTRPPSTASEETTTSANGALTALEKRSPSLRFTNMPQIRRRVDSRGSTSLTFREGTCLPSRMKTSLSSLVVHRKPSSIRYIDTPTPPLHHHFYLSLKFINFPLLDSPGRSRWKPNEDGGYDKPESTGDLR